MRLVSSVYCFGYHQVLIKVSKAEAKDHEGVESRHILKCTIHPFVSILVFLTERQSSIDHSVSGFLVLHHSAQIFEVLFTLVAFVGTVWNVISGSRTSVFKLGLGRQHVSGLLVPSDEVVDPIPCSVFAWAVGTCTSLHVLHSIGLRPESLHSTHASKGAGMDLRSVHLLVLFHAVLVSPLVVE